MTYRRLEDDIKRLYTRNGVTDTSKLNAELIAERLNYSIYYIDGISKYIDSHRTFYLSKHLSPQEKWQSFGHELCHAMWHAGSQMNMNRHYREYQEWQAKSFSYEACVPRFLLEKVLSENPLIHPVYLIAERFGVTYDFAETRYILHCMRMSQYETEKFHLAGV